MDAGSRRLTIDQIQEAARAAQRVADFAMVEHLARELISRCHAEEDVAGEGDGYAYLGGALVGRGQGAEATSAFRHSLELQEKIRNRDGIVRALNGLSVAAMDLSLDMHRARRFIDEALPIARETGDKRLLGIVLGNACEVARFGADYAKAIEYAREALALLEEIGDSPRCAWQLINIAHCQFIRRNHGAAIESLRTAYLHLKNATYDARVIAWFADVWFIVAAGSSQWRTAALLLGYVNQLREDKNLVRLQLLLPWIAGPSEQLWRSMPEAEVAALIQEGRTLSLERVESLTRSPGFDSV